MRVGVSLGAVGGFVYICVVDIAKFMLRIFGHYIAHTVSSVAK